MPARDAFDHPFGASAGADAQRAEAPPAEAAVDAAIRSATPLLWTNPALRADPAPGSVGAPDTAAAAARFARAERLLAATFAPLQATGGRIVSPLLPVPALQEALGLPAAHGRLWVKADHALPVAGSVKARGAMHEVLACAERLALAHGLVGAGEDLAPLAGAPARALFAQHEIAVGSTGNLGMGVGLMARALGFRARVHMSHEAKAWKKDRLRAHGVEVVEHTGDYALAVQAGREAAARDPRCHFVDDEQSRELLLGYSVAAAELQAQLAAAGIAVDAEHPLFVYLPCGVGGAPGGIAWGLRACFGPHVHCFFAEPVQAPCMLLQLRAPDGAHPSVYDWGLRIATEADGLAVPQASLLVAALMRERLAGVYTLDDATLFAHLARAYAAEGLRLEPSAAAGLQGPLDLVGTASGRAWLDRQGLRDHLPRAAHVAWTTGGALLPDALFHAHVARGEAVLRAPATAAVSGDPHAHG